MKIKNAVGIRRTTVELTDDVTAVDFGHDYKYFAIRNDGSGSIYVSTANKECIAGEDEVVLVLSGSSYVHYNGYGGNTEIYLSGTGNATVIAQDDGNNPFKPAQGGGGESYTHPAYIPRESGLYKISVDALGHVNSAEKVTKKDITDLGIPESDTTISFSDSSPKASGTASAGTSDEAARGDHVHPLQKNVSGSSGSCTGNSATATKLSSDSYCEITLNTSDWTANPDGGYVCTVTLDTPMNYERFNFEVVLSTDQAATKLQIEAWSCVIADGRIAQTTSNGSTTAFTFYAFTTQPSVALTVAAQGVS